MKRRLFLLSILFALLPGFAVQTVKKYWDQPDLKVYWSPIMLSPEGIEVVYEVKYGAIYTIPCIGLWESVNQYLITFKNKEGYRLEKSNIVSVYYRKIENPNFTKVK